MPTLDAQRVCYLRVDYTLVTCVQSEPGSECRSTPRYDKLREMSYVVIIIYAGVLPTAFGWLLFSQRDKLRKGESTPITRALGTLHNEYKPEAFYFEFVQVGITSATHASHASHAAAHQSSHPLHRSRGCYFWLASSASFVLGPCFS